MVVFKLINFFSKYGASPVLILIAESSSDKIPPTVHYNLFPIHPLYCIFCHIPSASVPCFPHQNSLCILWLVYEQLVKLVRAIKDLRCYKFKEENLAM